jgi:hypothetical protein
MRILAKIREFSFSAKIWRKSSKHLLLREICGIFEFLNRKNVFVVVHYHVPDNLLLFWVCNTGNICLRIVFHITPKKVKETIRILYSESITMYERKYSFSLKI